VLSVREAVFSPHEEISVEQALGRICAAPSVSCPPAIPVAVSGEIIGEAALELFRHYRIGKVDVVRQ
jgi:arginine/lysine/ornithine decarboxylase